jgi:uncharacterized protein (TIGR02145 family)
MRIKYLLIAIVMLNIAMSSMAQVNGTFTDSRDGKTYKTVKIGTQTWMANNLAYKASSGCWAYDNDKTNAATYGYLYDWETAKKVCPAGWHLPSSAEWSILTAYLGGEKIAGSKLKEAGTTHWANPNAEATNESGFSGLPGGTRQDDGQFTSIGVVGGWWSTTEKTWTDTARKTSTIFGNSITLNNDPDYPIELKSLVYSNQSTKETGYSVRCIRDN